MARQRAGACARPRRLARPARAGRGRARQARDGDHAATGKRAPACEEPRGGLRGGPAARAPAAPPGNCEKVSAEGVEEVPATGAQGLSLRDTVQAAGGVPMRRRDDGVVEVLLVHRPRYLDWTFPKGKVQDGERDEDAALRELREEAGLVCELGRELASTRYKDTKLRDKTVRYWVMENCSGSFESNDEVDRIEWLTLEEAAGRLSHRRDLDVLRSLELTR